MKMQNIQVDIRQSPEKPISHLTPESGVMNTGHPEMDESDEKRNTSDDHYSFEEEEMLLLLLD